jgi:hypothetical protein
MSALIKIHLTEEMSEATIEGNGKDCIAVLVEFFNTNEEVRKLFKTALEVERIYAIQEEMEGWKDNKELGH